MKTKYYKDLDETLISEKLDNGLEIYIVPKKGFATKCAYFATRFGSINKGDQILVDGKKITLIGGLGHFLEHRMFDYKKGPVHEIFNKYGAYCNAFTSRDYTAYYLETSDNFKECLDVLLDYPTSFTMKKEAVEKEKEIIVKEALMTQDKPNRKLMTAILENLYKYHPIKEPIVGTVEEIKSTTIEMLRTIHSNFYSPDNMVLLIVGDIDSKEVIEQVKNFKFEKRKCNLIPQELNEPKEVVRRNSTITCQGNVRKLMVGYKLEPIDKLEEKERLKVFTIVGMILDIICSNSNKFYKKLINHRLATDIDYTLTDYKDAFTVLIELDNIKDEEKMFKLVNKTLNKALSYIDENKIELAKKKQIARMIKECNSVNSICDEVLDYLIDRSNYFDLMEVNKSITLNDVKEVFNKYLLNANSSYVLMKGKDND